MPKETFFNLPPEKRQMIEDVAVEEFADWGFDNASINRIVDQCQIAKGSFYQYFEDKKDLYKYIVNRMGEEKIKFMSPVLLNPAAVDFFTLMGALYQSGLEFGKANPKAANLGNQLIKNKEHPVHKEIFDESKGSAEDFFLPMLKLAISRGEVRPDINLGFVTYILVALNMASFEYYYEFVKGKEFDIHHLDDMMDTIILFLDFIKNGIGTRIEGEKKND
jgi:AcrR family transcriptional regulator